MSDPTGSTTKRATRATPAPAQETPAPTKATFPYEQYLEDRDGTQYLPLKWRLAWLRADQPQARIATRLVSHEDGLAIFRAIVQLPEGASATGWGARSRAEGPGDDNSLDYITYAENQALSRALAVLGYGTQYALDFDPPADHPTILLPEATEEDEEDQGIVVPIAPRASSSQPATEDEEDTEEEGEPPTPAPRPIAPVRGEIRNIAERRPAFNSQPAAPETDEEDEEDEPPAPRPLVRPVANQTPAPAALSNTPASSGASTVDERVRYIRDEGLKALIKRIYFEARQRFNYDEDAVDKRSVDLYQKPTFDLNSTDADSYLERIVSAPPRRR